MLLVILVGEVIKGETDSMTKPTLTALCLFAFCGTMLRAESEAGATDTPTQETKVYYLNVSEASGAQGSWIKKENWSTVRSKEKQNDAEHPENLTDCADFGFIVPADSSGYTLINNKGKGVCDEWNGKYLQLGGIYSKKTNVAVLRQINREEGTYIWYKNDGLILGSCSKYIPYYSNDPYAVTGTVSVTANDIDCAALLSQRITAKNVTFSFLDTFQGARDSQFAIHSTTQNFNVVFHNATNYFGHICVTNVNEDATASVKFLSDCPGSIALTANTTLELDANVDFNSIVANEGSILTGCEGCTITNLTLDNVDWTMPEGCVVKNLVLQNGSILKANAGSEIESLTIDSTSAIDIASGSLTVTDSISHAGKIRFVASSFGGETESPRFMNIISFPATSGITTDVLEFVSANGEALDWDDWALKEENGVVTVEAFKAGYVKLKQPGDDKSYSGDFPSSMIDKDKWSDGNLPTNPLVDYVASYNLRTHDSSADWKNPTDDFVFRGHSLTIDGLDKRFIVCNRSFRCDDLILRNSASFYKRRYSGIKENDYHNLTVSGTITVENGNSPFHVGFYETLTLNNSFKGSGTVRLTSLSGVGTDASYGHIVITGVSPEFMGSIVVTIPYNMPLDPVTSHLKITPRFDRNYTRLKLTSKGNLGGELPALNRTAFTIENMSRVQPDPDIESLTLDEPTRGVFIKWVGRLYADVGQTFTVASPLAVHGTLWKEGAGTLVLANPAPTFGENADSETSIDQDATNRTFRVAGGDVKISSGDAVNGLDVVFTNGAGKIVLDLDSEDETFRTFGLRNTKSQTPFAVEGDIAQIPVMLDFDEPPARNTERALFTFAGENPESFLSSVSIVKGEALKGMVVERYWRVNENDNNSRTLVAKFTKVGLRIVIK